MKELLKKELGQTLSIIEEKNKELRRVHSQLEKGHLMVEGEEEALNNDDLCYFPLFAEREYKEGSADQMHFRLAGEDWYGMFQAAMVLEGCYENSHPETHTLDPEKSHPENFQKKDRNSSQFFSPKMFYGQNRTKRLPLRCRVDQTVKK